MNPISHRVWQRPQKISNSGGPYHIFRFWLINFFWNWLLLRFVNSNIWIWTPSVTDLPQSLCGWIIYWVLFLMLRFLSHQTCFKGENGVCGVTWVCIKLKNMPRWESNLRPLKCKPNAHLAGLTWSGIFCSLPDVDIGSEYTTNNIIFTFVEHSLRIVKVVYHVTLDELENQQRSINGEGGGG